MNPLLFCWPWMAWTVAGVMMLEAAGWQVAIEGRR